MRSDSSAFRDANTAPAKSPRFVVGIIFDVGSIYLTSHDDITGVPGTVIYGVLENISALSQRIVPDQGRSEIGSMSFDVVDRSGTFTTAVRSKLTGGDGLRGRTVKLWHGFEGFAFGDLQLFQTQILRSAEIDGAVYKVECSDITREQREQIFEPQATTLRLSCTDSETTLYVADTTDFVAVAHGTSYTDAPSATVGYFKVEDEIIRWTGKTADSFTGCTRGVLNTRAKAHVVNTNAVQDRRTRIEEVIYLEEPAIRLAYAILTGTLYGTASTLPDHWNLGIATSLVRTADWTGIGADLWDTSDATRGLILRFLRPKKQDGKAFLEKELFLLCGVFQRTYADGTIGLKRMAALTPDAAPVATLTENEIVTLGALQHDMPSLHNRFSILWGWDGSDFRRTSTWVDGNSQAVHGESEEFQAKFSGLAGARHTGITIRQRLTQMADRYSAPPERITVGVLGSLNHLEVGDVVRLNVANLRDYAGTLTTIDRSFEVQRVAANYVTGNVELELFGSTAKPTETPLDEAEAALDDAYYTAVGTDLDGLWTIDGSGNVSGGPYTLAGGADITASGSVWYYAGDLTIGSGVTVNITGNVQLRVKGYLTVNGTIDGVGYGHAGVADDPSASVFPSGVSGYVGNSRGRDGINVSQKSGNPVMNTIPAKLTVATHAVFPYLALTTADDRLSIAGLPTDLRGTGGAPGGKVTYQANTQEAAGGSGGTGGAGLLIVCRGLGFGVSGTIDLSGADGFNGTRWDDEGKGWNPGPGGAGGPGALLVLLDGDPVPLPDITGKFYGVCGTVGTPDPYDGKLKYLEQRGSQRYNLNDRNFAGYDDPSVISGADLSDAASRLQYVPYPVSPEDDADEPPEFPANISASSGPGYVLVTWSPPPIPGAWVQVYATASGILSDAELVGETQAGQFYHALLDEQERGYFLRTKVLVDNSRFVYSPYSTNPLPTVTETAGPVTDVMALPEEPDFLETWEGQDAETRYTSTSGTGAITYPLNGSFGGRVLRVAGGMRALVFNTSIPLDPAGFYRMTARVRMVTAPTSSSTDGVYIGFRAVAADGFTPLYTGGIDHYPVASNLDLGSATLGEWQTLIGYILPSSTTVLSPAPSVNSPSGVVAGAAYIRPVITLNYLDGDGTQEVDYLRVERMIAGRWFDILGDGKPSDYADVTGVNAPYYTGVWHETWQHANWERFWANRGSAGNVTITYPTTGLEGGIALRVRYQWWATWRTPIPFDPSALYRMTLKIRRYAASTSGSGYEQVTCGVECLAADGETLINTAGANSASAQHAVCAFGYNLAALSVGQTATLVGYFADHGTPDLVNAGSILTPSPLYTGVRYIRPYIVVNEAVGDGTCEIDSIKVERLIRVQTGLIDEDAVTDRATAESANPSATYIVNSVGGGGTVSGWVYKMSYTPDQDCTLVLTGTWGFDGGGTVAEGTTVDWRLRAVNGAAQLGTIVTRDLYDTVEANPHLSLTEQFSGTAGVTYDVGIWATLPDMSSNYSVSGRYVTLRLLAVKR